jgi:outer membrane lipoprotein SlyB
MAFRRWVTAAATGLVLAMHAWPALALDGSAALGVDSINVERVTELAPGTPINVNVYGSPRAVGVVRIEGARRLLDLHETAPGVYEGTYVIDPGDAIRADSRVTAALQRGGEIARSIADEPLLLGRNALPWTADAPAAARPPLVIADATPPRGESLQALPARPLVGAPVPSRPQDEEARSGTTTLRAVPPPPRTVCADCAYVESVRSVEASRSPGVVGAIGGGIAGAIIANEIDHARRALQVLGAIGGALIGRQVELAATRQTSYEVRLRLRDGSVRTQRFERPPPFAAGDTVHLGSGRVDAAPPSL